MSYNRITKKELMDFVKWHIEHCKDENYNKLGCKRISELYFNETGKHIGRATVNNNRYNWFMKDGKLVKIE